MRFVIAQKNLSFDRKRRFVKCERFLLMFRSAPRQLKQQWIYCMVGYAKSMKIGLVVWLTALMHDWVSGLNEVNCLKLILYTVGYSSFFTNRNKKSCQSCYCRVRNRTTSKPDRLSLHTLWLLQVSYHLLVGS